MKLSLKTSLLFDASFFSYGGKEAEALNPQHRLFLECAWEALEEAGYAAKTEEYNIGIYAGEGHNDYGSQNKNPQRSVLALQNAIARDSDFLATKTAFKFNLRGPAVSVQNACSTSLVAVAQAVQALQSGTCEICLAGAVSLRHLKQQGYLFEEGSIISPDGHCRPFSQDAG